MRLSPIRRFFLHYRVFRAAEWSGETFMAPPIQRMHSAVRAYGDRLRDLMDHLRGDPLDEAASVALVAHIINNRSTAAQLFDGLDTHIWGSLC